jgi:hypothetical protein
VHPSLAAEFPAVSLSSVNVDGYSQFVAKIADNDLTANRAQATVAIPKAWRTSGNVYATVYWAAEKTDGNVKLAIGYDGLALGKLPFTVGYQEYCADSSPAEANIIQSCTKKISDLIYEDDELSYISVNRYGYIYAGLENPDTNTGDVYIYGIKLELRD